MKRSSFLKLPVWDLALSGLISKSALMLFCLVLSEPAQSQDNPPFLSGDARQIVGDSTYIEIRDIARMRYFPALIPPTDPERNKIASPEQLKLLQDTLLNAMSIDASKRLSSCKYLPGAEIRFFREKPEKKEGLYDTMPDLRVLLCFNCDLWAVEHSGHGGKSKKQTMAFGDSKPNAQLLKNLFTKLFGEAFLLKDETERRYEKLFEREEIEEANTTIESKKVKKPSR